MRAPYCAQSNKQVKAWTVLIESTPHGKQAQGSIRAVFHSHDVRL